MEQATQTKEAQTEITDLGDYCVKAVKFFEGMDGQGFNANLYRGKKKVAFALDEGCGGEVMARFDSKEERVLYQKHLASLPKHLIRISDTPPKRMQTKEEIVRDGKAKEEETKYDREFVVDVDNDLFISALIYKWEDAKEKKRMRTSVKRKLAKHIYLLKPNGSISFYKTPPTDVAIDFLMPKNPKGSILLNTLPFEEALGIFEKFYATR